MPSTGAVIPPSEACAEQLSATPAEAEPQNVISSLTQQPPPTAACNDSEEDENSEFATLTWLLGRASDSTCLSAIVGSGRGLRIHTEYSAGAAKCLTQLLCDPLWVPTAPTRQDQITSYCTEHKLSYNAVSTDRQNKVLERSYLLHRTIRHPRNDKLTSGCLSPDGTLLATTSYDMTCKIWDVQTQARLHTLAGHEGHLSECAWSNSGDKIITSSFDKTLKMWDVASGEVLSTCVGHDAEVVTVVLSPDGKEFASGGMDDIVIIWDMKGHERLTLVGHRAEVVAIAYSPTGDLIASASADETIRLWVSKDGSCRRVLSGHTAEVGHVCFNKFGNLLLSSSLDSTCRLWDICSDKYRVLRGHTAPCVDCAFSPDGWLCASASEDCTARVWDILTGGCLSMMVGAHVRGVACGV